MTPAATFLVLAWAAACLAAFALAATMAGYMAVRRFARAAARVPAYRPPVSLLRPLCGDEPMLEQALASICAQNYPDFQIVLGVQDHADTALLVARQMQDRFPGLDIAIVVDPALHGPNRKISNLINMLPLARHDLLVFSDSDLHVAPDYLDCVVAALEAPGIGLVTTVCTGLPTVSGPAALLGAMGISHSFVPGALLSRMLGREDCLGTTMALRRETLARIGGLDTLVRHLADDNVLAKRVTGLGLRIVLAGTVPKTGVPERSLRALWQHELRWARTIRAMEPMLFATSTLQYPLFWALSAWLLAGGAAWATGLLLATWLIRAASAWGSDMVLLGGVRRPGACPAWLLPLRDVMSVALVATSYLGGRVVWRGHVMWADDGRPTLAVSLTE